MFVKSEFGVGTDTRLAEKDQEVKHSSHRANHSAGIRSSRSGITRVLIPTCRRLARLIWNKNVLRVSVRVSLRIRVGVIAMLQSMQSRMVVMRRRSRSIVGSFPAAVTCFFCHAIKFFAVRRRGWFTPSRRASLSGCRKEDFRDIWTTRWCEQ
jgi:hypothetical protein